MEELRSWIADRLARDVDPELFGFRLLPVRARGLEGASGTTDFAGLFGSMTLSEFRGTRTLPCHRSEAARNSRASAATATSTSTPCRRPARS